MELLERWGVTTTVAIDLPATPDAHQNLGLVNLNDRINTFLSEHYTWDTPNTVILAVESKLGSYGQDDLGKFEPDKGSLGVNLDKLSLVSQRTLSLHMRDGTKAVQGGDLAVVLMDRYKDAVEDALDDLNDQYPLITGPDLLAMTQSMYVTWENGRTRLLSLDGVSGDNQSRSDSEIYQQLYTEPLNRYNDPENINTLPGYLIEVGRFAQQGSGLLFKGGPGQIWQYLQAHAQIAEDLGFSAGAANFFKKANDAIVEATGGFEIESLDQGKWEQTKKYGAVKFFQTEEYEKTTTAAFAVYGAFDTAKSVRKLYKAGHLWKSAKEIARLQKAANTAGKASKMAKLGKVLGAASLFLEVGLVITQFVLTGDFSPAAFALLMATILVAVILFLLSIIPVWVMSVVIAIFGLIDAILTIFFDFSISGEAAKAIAKFFYDITPLTEMGDVSFAGRKTGLVDEDMGYVVGNRYRVSDTFTGEIKTTGEAGHRTRRALELSFVCAEYKVYTNTLALSTANTSRTDCNRWHAFRSYDWSAGTVTYINQPSLEIKFETAGEATLKYTDQIVVQTANRECVWGGIYCGWKTTRMTLPDEMPKKNQWKPTIIRMDILPASLDGFWKSENTYVTNHDPDGDGWTTAQEVTTRLGSTAFAIFEDDLAPIAVNKLKMSNAEQLLTNWDQYETRSDIRAWCNANYTDWNLCDGDSSPFWLKWDSDGDGLSDKFEFDENGTLGTNYDKYDTDGDGLSDGQEYRLGTRINQADSDLDGLFDGEEAFHQNQDGSWSGGWTIEVLKAGAVGPSGRYTMTIPVYSDPRSADSDGDGLSDLAEKENGSSPLAYNRVPRVTLKGEPLAVSPDGQSAVYVKPGDTITLTTRVEAFQPYEVESTLSLTLPWHLLAAAQIGAMQGDRTPPNTGAADRPKWSFANTPLLPGEASYVQTTAQTAGPQSMTGTANLRLPLSPVGWRPLGSGADASDYVASISALAVDPDNDDILYVGGQFDTAGGRSANYIARWNGSSWAALSTGMNNPVYAIAVTDDGDVYAGGAFTQAGGVTANRIAKWDGGNWSALGDGFDNSVYGLAIASNGDLYAVGSFRKAGDTVVNGVAKWNGSSWSAVGGGLDDITSSWGTSVAIDSDDNVYVGGHFYSVGGGVSTSHIAKWNGSSWGAMNGIHGGGGLYGSVKAIAIAPDTDQVYAGGDFWQVHGNDAKSSVIKWNGSWWQILPDIASNPDDSQQECYALAFSTGGQLYAGVGTPSSGHVAISNLQSLLYTPTLTGTETFTYTVSDGSLADTATVNVAVVEGDKIGGRGETLLLPNTGRNNTITVTIEIPPDVVSGNEHFALVYGASADPGEPPQGYRLAGLAFSLDAYVDTVPTSPFTFDTPITLTIVYGDADMAGIGRGEEGLELRYWDGDEWRSDSGNVTIVSRDTEQNRLVITIGHLTEFALIGQAGFEIYLPLVLKP